jgi:regulatory protein
MRSSSTRTDASGRRTPAAATAEIADTADTADSAAALGESAAATEDSAEAAAADDGATSPAAEARPTKPCYDRACELLARRPHFRRELALKLGRRGYAAAEVAAALDRLTAQGYIDDGATSRSLVSARQARGGLGPARLRAELARRGADPAAAAAALATLPADELPAAREAARRWHGRDAAALARHLARKGFSRRAIFAVLKDHPAAAELPDRSDLDAGAWDDSGEPDDIS